MKETRRKRKYERPTMLIYEMKKSDTILLSSGVRDPYDPIPWPDDELLV